MAMTSMPPQWVKYWTTGPGAAEINFGVPGDFDRCIVAIQAKVTQHGEPPLSDPMIKGLCATLHKMVTGATPGRAPGEHHG